MIPTMPALGLGQRGRRRLGTLRAGFEFRIAAETNGRSVISARRAHWPNRRDAVGCGAVQITLRRIGHDAHLDLHAEVVRRKSDIGAMKRDRVARIGDNCYGDKVDVADAAACRIEINPSVVRQINLRPGMSSIPDLSCPKAPADCPRGSRDTPTQNARRNQSSASRRSSA